MEALINIVNLGMAMSQVRHPASPPPLSVKEEVGYPCPARLIQV